MNERSEIGALPTEENPILWDDGKVIHLCESSEPIGRMPRLVWTKCEKDVPANAGFRSEGEHPNCPECLK
jgi:hypothetical protein